MAPTEGELDLPHDGEENQIIEPLISDVFECTYCEKSFLGPPQSNQQLQLYKDHLTEFHKMSKEVNKMIHQVASEYKAKIESKRVLTSKDNKIPDKKEKEIKSTSIDISTQTYPKDFYRHFMHQDWDCSIDWKAVPRSKVIATSTKASVDTKENQPKQDNSSSDSLPVIEQALSLNKEDFDNIGEVIKFPISDMGSTKLLGSPKKNLISASKKEESPNKKRELDINAWTRPVKSNIVTLNNASQPNLSKSVKLRWEEKDKNLNGKYTFDLIKEPEAKRQKIVVRFKQEEDKNVKLKYSLSKEASIAGTMDTKVISCNDQSLIGTYQGSSANDRLLGTQIISTEQSTNLETADSNIYTFDDVVMEEEVVSSEIQHISGNLPQNGEPNQQDSLSQIIENTIGNTVILDNEISGCVEENVTYEIVEAQTHTSSIIEGANEQVTDLKVNNAANKPPKGPNSYHNETETKTHLNVISMPTVEI